MIGDNPNRLKEALLDSLEVADLIIFTGGLGPTKDDLTKETIFEALNLEAIVHEPSRKILENKFSGSQRAMKNNFKQSIFPKEAVVLPNDFGTAPGCFLKKDGKNILILPGPPREMKPMFMNYAKTYLQKADGVFYTKKLRIIGMGEWKMNEILGEFLDLTNPTVAPNFGENGLYIRITGKAKTFEEAKQSVFIVAEKIKERFGDDCYGEGEQTIQEVCGELLLQNGQSISFAESITGGMCASFLIDVPGISDVLKESYIVYSDQAKHEMLGVDQELLEKYTAVSEEVCEAMLHGLKKKTGCDYGVATTGYAGPGGDDVGLVFLGVYSKNGHCIKIMNYMGERNIIRKRATRDALDLLRRALIKNVSRETK